MERDHDVLEPEAGTAAGHTNFTPSAFGVEHPGGRGG